MLELLKLSSSVNECKPLMAGIAPYAAINFASYDLGKKMWYGEGGKQDAISNLIVGGISGRVTFLCTIIH
jgi:solute carrier family 25 phosphate transporter 23/24/25/41